MAAISATDWDRIVLEDEGVEVIKALDADADDWRLLISVDDQTTISLLGESRILVLQRAINALFPEE